MPYVVVLAILSIGVALFAIQNAVAVTLNFMMFTFETSLVLVILGSFTIGLLVGAGFMVAMKAKQFLAQRRQKEEKFKLEAEVKRHKERVAELEKERDGLKAALAAQQQQAAPPAEGQQAAAPTAKEEAKQEVKQEAKQEVKQEAKQEGQQEAKQEAKTGAGQ